MAQGQPATGRKLGVVDMLLPCPWAELFFILPMAQASVCLIVIGVIFFLF